MANFFLEIKRDPEYLNSHLDEFFLLDDQKVHEMFLDDDIDTELKEILVSKCSERIKKLPFSIFLDVIMYVGNSDDLLKYEEQINSMNYSEFVSLLYDALIFSENDCLLCLKELPVFSKHLNAEKSEKKGFMLTRFLLETELFETQNDHDKLLKFGIQLYKKLNDDSYNDDYESIIDKYLECIINNQVFSPSLLSISMSLIDYHMSKDRILSSSMLKFYILNRVRELGLSSTLENIFISDERSGSVFGFFNEDEKKIQINRDYYEERYSDIFSKIKIDNHSKSLFLNSYLLQGISHELGHALKHKKMHELTSLELENIDDLLSSSLEFNYFFRNGLLHVVGEEGFYTKNHDEFIEEIQADIFSYLDVANVLKKFPKTFSDDYLAKFSSTSASLIVSFYTVNTEETRKVVPPLKKFERFLEKYLHDNRQFFSDFDRSCLETTIDFNSLKDQGVDSLLLGGPIPRGLLESLDSVSRNEIIITNINDFIMDYYRNNTLGIKR